MMPQSEHVPTGPPAGAEIPEPSRSRLAGGRPAYFKDRGSLARRGVAAAALAVSAYVHVALAAGPVFADGQVTLAGLFIAQAVAAAVVALWVLARGSRSSWWATGVVGVASLIALVVSVYVLVPSIGPFPAFYEPFWYAEKVVAAGSAAVAAATAVIALLRPTR